jgi:hypothetical protein
VGLPLKPGMIEMPYFNEIEEGKFEARLKREKRNAVDPSRIKEEQKILKKRLRGGDIIMKALPAYSATVEDIEAIIDTLEHYANFIPDVIIIDYADIIAPSRGFRGEYRHQLDDIWKKLRGMAQRRNCLVCTATQADKSTFDTDIKETHVPEDIRKLAHVTDMIALNQTVEEAKNGIVRVSQIAIREGRRQFQQAIVLQCLDIARPCVDSRLKSQMWSDPEKIPDGPKKRKRGRG